MKKTVLAATVILFSAWMAVPAYAAGWQKDPSGWRWQRDDETFVENGWEWLDGNQDQIAECYYFDKYGYILRNTETPDGHQVNPDGSWVVDGVVQSRRVGADGELSDSEPRKGSPVDGGYANQSLGYRLELAASAAVSYGEEQPENIDVKIMPFGRADVSSVVTVGFEKKEQGQTVDDYIAAQMSAKQAVGFESEKTEGIVLGDGNTYIKTSFTLDDMRINYWTREAGDYLIYFSTSASGVEGNAAAEAVIAAVKAY